MRAQAHYREMIQQPGWRKERLESSKKTDIDERRTMAVPPVQMRSNVSSNSQDEERLNAG